MGEGTWRGGGAGALGGPWCLMVRADEQRFCRGHYVTISGRPPVSRLMYAASCVLVR
jgi:hypothetical protein